MDAAGSSETLISCHITIRCQNPEDLDLNLQRAADPKSVTSDTDNGRNIGRFALVLR